MDCALVFLPIWDSMTPPLSLAYLTSALTRHGIKSRAFDLSLRFRPVMLSSRGDIAGEAAILARPELVNQWMDEVLKDDPQVVGFSVLDSNARVTEHFCDLLRRRRPGIKIVFGGSRYNSHQMYNIRAGLEHSDGVVEGEGEECFPPIVRALLDGKSIAGMSQVWTKGADGNPSFGGFGAKVDLKQKPFADFSDFDLEAYPRDRCLPLMFSRGCVLNCTFCTNKWNDVTQRTRTGEDVFAEFKHMVETYRPRNWMFNDDSLISRITIKEIEKFCDLVIAEDLVLPWAIYGTRVERLLTPEFIRKMRKSGLSRVWLGVESFSSAVQRDMGKSSNFELADKVAKMFIDEGVRTSTWLIYGYPTESDSCFEETYGWLEKNGHLLESMTVNAFGVSERMQETRPNGTLHYKEGPWAWESAHSTVEKRRERFLRLIELLSNLKKAHPGMSFSIGDPHHVKYFRDWNNEESAFLQSRWEEFTPTTVKRGVSKWWPGCETIDMKVAPGREAGDEMLTVEGASQKGGWHFASSSPLVLESKARYKIKGTMQVTRLSDPSLTPHLTITLFSNGKYLTSPMSDHYSLDQLGDWQDFHFEFETPDLPNVKGVVGVTKRSNEIELEGQINVGEIQVQKLGLVSELHAPGGERAASAPA